MEAGHDMRMDAYYYSFGKTGVLSVDKVLSAVACAGKSYHHTEDWTSECEPRQYHSGTTPAEWIQDAADDAATQVRALVARVRALEAWGERLGMRYPQPHEKYVVVSDEAVAELKAAPSRPVTVQIVGGEGGKLEMTFTEFTPTRGPSDD